MIFRDRIDAGQRLATLLQPIKVKDPIILGLPRGGVPVASQVAQSLHRPLDVLIVRKLGVPWQPELAFGAVGEEGQIYFNQSIVNEIGISQQERDEIVAREGEEVRKRELRFRGDRSSLDIAGKCVIIVDDGIATGATAEVACRIARSRGASEVIMAAPVAARATIEKLSAVADECIVLYTPDEFDAVGQWYEDFHPVTDDEVADIMRRAKDAR